MLAGFIQRPDEYDSHFAAREFLATFEQPGIEPIRVENAPLRSTFIPEPVIAPAPEMGEHTQDIVKELLAVEDEDIDRLFAANILQEAVTLIVS